MRAKPGVVAMREAAAQAEGLADVAEYPLMHFESGICT
jgi:hypothetical protein